MASDIKEIFRRVIDQIDEEEKNDLLGELKNKKLTSSELVDAIRNLPPNERAAVRDAFIEVAEQEGGTADKAKAKELDKEAQKEEEARGVEDEETPPVEEKKKKNRPGRKNGKAYGWYIDDKGRVKVSDVAQVYSGEDEPDEVELYPDDEEDEENDEE
jgi:hypothetical protein